MEFASGRQRVTAYWIDFLILISVIFTIKSALWILLPETQLKVGGMLSYKASDFRNFFLTVGTSFIFILIYFYILPFTKFKRTLGQRIAKIRILKIDEEALTIKTNMIRILISSIKYGTITLGGPTLAFSGRAFYHSIFGTELNFAATWFLLLMPVFFFSVLSVQSWRQWDGAGFIENLSGIRYYSEEESTVN